MNNGKYFERGGRGVYKCVICDRSTRVTTQCDDHLCPECWDLAGLENTVFDNGAELAREWGTDKERDALLAKAVKRGANGDKIKKNFPELFEV